MSFTRKTLTSAIWALSSGYAGIVISFVGNLILARLLLPEDFGIFAFAASLLVFLSMFTGFGSQEGIVQCRDVSIQNLIPTAFWMGFAIAALVAVIGLIGGLIIGLKGDATMGILFILLAMIVPISSLANSHAAVLKRDMYYKPIAVTRTITTILSFISGITAALAGLGPWALFVRQGSDTVIYWLLIKRASGYELELDFDRQAAKWIWDFGWRKMVSQISEGLVFRYDNIMVGLFLGETTLGYYTQAFRLAGLGQQFTEGTIAPILHPMFAMLQNSIDRLRYGFQRVSYWLIRLTPLFGLFALLLGKDAVVLVYGERWATAGDYFTMMSLLIIFIPLTSALKNFLIGAGQITKAVRTNLIQLAFFVLGVSLGGLMHDIIFIVWIVNLNQVLGMLLMGYYAYQLLRVNWFSLCAAPALAFVLTAIGANLIRLRAHSLLDLVLGAFVITAVYAVIIVLFDHQTLRQEVRILWNTRKA